MVANSFPTCSVLGCVLLCACGAGDRSADDPRLGPGSFAKYSFGAEGLPQRDYYVYRPTTLPAGPVPLVVYLHGCQQTAPDAALGTRWNEKAEAERFIVIYPEQKLAAADDNYMDGNGGRCWNWFEPQHWSRGAGEAATIAGITQAVMAQYSIDPARVYVGGISAGGAMTAVMGATYPDLYAALGILAGVAYQGDSSGAAAAQAMGQYARAMPALVFQGTADDVVPFPLGATAVEQWLGTDDLVDDGSANNSISRLPASMENHGVDASLLAGLGSFGDFCVNGPLALPCLGAALGLDEYPYSVQHYLDSLGKPLLDFWIVHGLGHAYAGGSREGSFTDPIGPSATDALFDFFMAHARSAQ